MIKDLDMADRDNIRTDRLLLIPARIPLLEAALAGPDLLAAALALEVPDSWPPDFLDEGAIRYTIDHLRESPSHAAWGMYFICLCSDDKPEILVGSAGYKGPPTADGTVEVGYGVVSEMQRNGYATEATIGLLRRAFQNASVRRAIAETLPELKPSIGVLEKIGFTYLGEGSEAGVIRFELTRDDFQTPPLAQTESLEAK